MCDACCCFVVEKPPFLFSLFWVSLTRSISLCSPLFGSLNRWAYISFSLVCTHTFSLKLSFLSQCLLYLSLSSWLSIVLSTLSTRLRGDRMKELSFCALQVRWRRVSWRPTPKQQRRRKTKMTNKRRGPYIRHQSNAVNQLLMVNTYRPTRWAIAALI